MKALQKDFVRELKQSKLRFFYIMAIIALGISFFVGLKSTAPSMKKTAAKYFRETKLADMHLVSIYGFEESDLDKIAAAEEAYEVWGAYSMDVVSRTGDTSYVTKIMSWDEDKGLNLPQLQEGRMPEKADECVIQKPKGAYTGAAIGETIEITDESQSESVLSNLKVKTFTVVGYVDDPLYLTHDRGSTTVGKGTLDNYMLVPSEAFSYERYTDCWILSKATVDGVSPFSEDYTESIDKLETEENAIMTVLVQDQYDSIYDEASQTILDSQKELDQKKAETQTQLDEAKQELDDAKVQLDAALVQIEEGESAYSQGLSQYESGLSQYQSAASEIAASREQLNTSQAQLNEAKNALLSQSGMTLAQADEKMTQVKEGISQLDAAIQSIDSAAAQKPALEEALEQVNYALKNDPDNQELLAKKAMLEESIEKIDQGSTMRPSLVKQRDELSANQESLNQVLSSYETIDINQQKIDAGFSELSSGENQLAASKTQLDQAKATLDASLITLNEGKESYKTGLQSYEEGLTEYQDGVQEAEEQFSDAQKQIDDAKKELSDLEEGKYYLYTREDYVGYSDYSENSTRIAKIANVFPVFFLCVAMLVCFATMTRMVEEQRGEIGTLVALGYSKGQIILKYVLYAASAAGIGCVVGSIFGSTFFPWFIYNAYNIMYNMPSISIQVSWSSVVIGVIVAMLCTVGASVLVCLYQMREVPAEMMRPKAPKPGKRIFLEKITPIWSRMSFIAKVSARNVLRYKSRFFMTVLGIAGCTALLLAGFGLHDAIFSIVPNQFEKIQKYDLLSVFSESGTAAEKQTSLDELASMEDVQSILLVSQEQMTAKSDQKNLSVYVVVPEDPQALSDFIQLDNRESGETIELSSEGAVISERMEKLLGLQAGDSLNLSTDEKDYSVKVIGIAENYLENYVYMTPEIYKKMTGEDPSYNIAYMTLISEDTDQSAVAETLVARDDILSVQQMGNMVDTVNQSINSLNLVVVVIVVFAGILAFIVLFNLTNINISERIREIATLKVLGFREKETTHYIFRENLVLSLIGMIVGLGLGVILLNFILDSVETDIMMFGREIYFQSYIYACLMTVGFTLIVNWAMTPSIKRVDMVEALKSIE